MEGFDGRRQMHYEKKKTLPSATLATTNPTRTELASHSGLPDERLATNESWYGLCED